QKVPHEEPGEPLVRATLQGVSDEEREERRRNFRRAAWPAVAAVAACLVIGAFQFYFSRLQASPIDLRIHGQSALQAGSLASLRIRLFDRTHGATLGNVPVKVELRSEREQVELASFKTDTHGTGSPQFRLPDWAGGSYELRITAE